MPIQDLEKLFNMKVNKYEAQGQQLQQAAQSAASEMKQDPRVMQLVKTYKGQNANPSDVNTRTEGQPKQTKSSGNNAGMGIVGLLSAAINNGLFANLEQGSSTANQDGYTEEGQSSDTSEVNQASALTDKDGNNLPANVAGYSYSQASSNIPAARAAYKNLKMAEESTPYELPLKGYAPPTYFGIKANNKITDWLKKKPIEDEEKGVVDNLKSQSGSESWKFFNPNQMSIDDSGKLNGKSGASDDIYQKALDDRAKFTTTGMNLIGVTKVNNNTELKTFASMGWANQAILRNAYGTAEQLLNESMQNLWGESGEYGTTNSREEKEYKANAEKKLREIHLFLLRDVNSKLPDNQKKSDKQIADANDSWFTNEKSLWTKNEQAETKDDYNSTKNDLSNTIAELNAQVSSQTITADKKQAVFSAMIAEINKSFLNKEITEAQKNELLSLIK